MMGFLRISYITTATGSEQFPGSNTHIEYNLKL